MQSMIHARVAFLVLVGGLLLTSGSPEAGAQNRSDSPVFKTYKPPESLPLLSQSDPIYQIWQTFLVARKASAGDVLAQHELGLRYLTGTGVDADTVKAAYWIQKAAEQNLLPARFNLAILAYHGWGIEWNPFESYRNFLFCAEHDMLEAEYVLSQFLLENLVVPQDLEKAYAWVKKAADAGHKGAQEALPELEKRRKVSAKSAPSNPLAQPVQLAFGPDTASRTSGMDLLRGVLQGADPEVKKALGFSNLLDANRDIDSIGLSTVQNAAEAGSPEALAVLGRCYEKGDEVEKDPVRAAFYYLRAIRMDSPRAGELLWTMVKQKDFFPELKARSGRDDADAQYSWAAMLALGFGQLMFEGEAFLTEAQAVQLLRKAAGRGHLQATIELGLCYYSGRWVAQDHARALELWREAARGGSREAEIRLAVTTFRDGSSTGEYAAAAAVLVKGVEDGSVLAEMGLGFCFENGVGVQRSFAVAARLYRSGARRGSQDAFRALKRMHDQLRPPQPEYIIPDL